MFWLFWPKPSFTSFWIVVQYSTRCVYSAALLFFVSDLSVSLWRCVSTSRCRERICSETVFNVSSLVCHLVCFLQTVRSFQDAQNNFSDRAGALNQAVANLLEAARSGDMSLAEAAQRLAEDFLNMLNAAQAVDDASKVNSLCWQHFCRKV